VKAHPGNTVEESFLAWMYGQLGAAEQARLDLAFAAQAYARSVEMFEKLDQAGALKPPFFRDEPSDPLGIHVGQYGLRLVLCRKAEGAIRDLDFALRQPAAEVSGLLDLRVRFLLREHQLATAVESALKMKQLAADEPERLYAAGCGYALCAGVARQLKSPVASSLGSEKLAKEALALLKQAVAKGFKNAAHMKKDKDLHALRARKDFKKLLAELEAAKKD
jgi:hypothetical protein